MHSRPRPLAVIIPLSLTLFWLACTTPTASNDGDGPPEGDAPDFSLSVDPASRVMEPDDTVSFNVDIAFLNGFTSINIDLEASGLPAGVTATFVPNPLPHQGRSVLTLIGDGTLPAGNYVFAVSAVSEGIEHSLQRSVEISLQPTFQVTISPSSQNVAAGGSADYTLMLASLNAFSEPVTLSASGLPSGASAQFAPNPVTPTGSSTLTITTTGSTPTGVSALTVTATGGGITQSLGAQLAVTAPGSTWGIASVGSTGDQNNTVRVGPLRNDGIDRVYVGTVNTGRVFEFSRSGGGWSAPVDVGGSPANAEIHNMGMGPGRDDGVTRLYAGSLDQNLYELSYTGSGWTQATVGSGGGVVFHAVVGNGRNDGVNRVYAGRGTGVYEYTWTGSGWSEVQVGSAASNAHGLALGDGRGDGLPRLYVATTAHGVYEATFSGGSWTMGQIANLGDVRNVNVGDGRDDGVGRVYAAGANGVMTEVSWNGAGWSTNAMNAPVGGVMIHAYVMAGRNDGVSRVYGSAGNGNAYEFTFDGSGWNTVVLGGGSDYMYGFHFGDARGDGLTRLYGASFNTQVYEYSWQ